MTLLKALLPLAALLLLSVVPSETKVVNSIAECKGFLVNDNPPNITRIFEGGKILGKNRYKLICQTLNNKETFVTLYDTENKIPVFSAAKYRGHEGPKPPKRPNPPPWMIEPQLEKRAGDNNMTPAEDNKFYNHQAGLPDYKEVLKQGFNKGHLFPSSYGFNEDEMNSTFTLTNIVPQNEDFNNRRWNNMEKCVQCVMNKYCINDSNKIEGFVVIGAQPSTNNILNDGVNIPSMLWSAFCCKNKKNKWLASAHWGENIERNKEYLELNSLNKLYNKLGGKYKVFPKKSCPLYSEVDSELKSSCNCS